MDSSYFCKKYKPGKDAGSIQHCMFGCLMVGINPLYFPLVGGTEVVDFQWGDLVDDYIGAYHGLPDVNAYDCRNKCKQSMCCD